MQDQITGVSIANKNLWEARRFKFNDGSWWLGTGIDAAGFLHFMDMRGAIDYMISRYPGTTGMRVVMNDKFWFSDVAAASRKSMLDGILATITKEVGDETTEPTEAETLPERGNDPSGTLASDGSGA